MGMELYSLKSNSLQKIDFLKSNSSNWGFKKSKLSQEIDQEIDKRTRKCLIDFLASNSYDCLQKFGRNRFSHTSDQEFDQEIDILPCCLCRQTLRFPIERWKSQVNLKFMLKECKQNYRYTHKETRNLTVSTMDKTLMGELNYIVWYNFNMNFKSEVVIEKEAVLWKFYWNYI